MPSAHTDQDEEEEEEARILVQQRTVEEMDRAEQGHPTWHELACASQTQSRRPTPGRSRCLCCLYTASPSLPCVQGAPLTGAPPPSPIIIAMSLSKTSSRRVFVSPLFLAATTSPTTASPAHASAAARAGTTGKERTAAQSAASAPWPSPVQFARERAVRPRCARLAPPRFAFPQAASPASPRHRLADAG